MAEWHSEDMMITPRTAGAINDKTRNMAGTGSRNVLIVDDDRLICWALERLIAADDFLVTSVNSGEEAIAALSRIPFALAFLDVHLPDADGLELLREIRKISPGTRVTVMTADSSEALRQEALLGGAAMFLEKPFGVSEIREALGSVPDRSLDKRSG